MKKLGKIGIIFAALAVLLGLILGLAITTPAQAADSPNVTLNVNDSDNAALDGVKVYYNDYGNHYVYLGTTSGGTVTATLPDGLSTKFKAVVLGHSVQIKPATVPCTVDFQTLEFVVHVMKSDDSDFDGIKAEWNDYGNHYYSMGNTGPDGTASIELFPGEYRFKASKDHTQQTGLLEVATSGASGTIHFQTALAVGLVKDCDNGNPIEGIQVSFYDYTNHWLYFGPTDASGEASIELFPGTGYTFRASTLHTSQSKTDDLAAAGLTVEFNPTRICLSFSSTVRFNDYSNHWQTVPCGTYLFPGTYDFKFGAHVESLTISGCALEGNVFIFKTIDSSDDPLANIRIYRNDYGNHYVSVGTTDSNGLLFTTDLPSGTWKFRASLKHTNQYVTSGPALITFQTAEFVVHVKQYDGYDFAGIKAYYNDYGNHYLSMGKTDASGNASIELFPGNYRFKAYKNHTQQTGYLELATSGASGTIEFRTALFIVHVMKSDNSNFEGIKASFNDYGNHYLSMGKTGHDGTASIELFPGNYKFKAYKDHTQQTGSLEVATSGDSGTIDFQTALAEGFARDCDNDNPIQGIKISFNDYGNHWLSMGLTGPGGKASIELFPGSNYKFRGYTQHTQQVKTVDLPSAGVVVELNPTRVCFTYSGSIKFNDYGNHWVSVPCGTYLFPGTYSFKFDSYVVPITVSGCEMASWPTLIHFEESDGTPIKGDKAWYKDYYIPGGEQYAGMSDAKGNIFVLIPDGNHNGNIDYFKGEDKSYDEFKNQYDISANPVVTFKTVNVTVNLQDHDLDGTTDDLSGNEAYGLYVDAYAASRQPFGSGTTTGYQETMELLPSQYKYTFEMRYEGVKEFISGVQITPANDTVTFSTGQVHDCTGTVVKYDSYSQSPHNLAFTDRMDMLTNHYTLNFYNASGGLVGQGDVTAGGVLEIGTCSGGEGDEVSDYVFYDPWFVIDHAKIDFKKKVDDDKVRVQGKLALDLVSGNGVDISEPVTVTVGPLSAIITMVEKGKKGEKWEYKRPKGGEGNIKHMTINWKNGKFDIRMDKADLTGVSNPVTISIQIGDDLGEETVQMTEKKHHWDYKAPRH